MGLCHDTTWVKQPGRRRGRWARGWGLRLQASSQGAGHAHVLGERAQASAWKAKRAVGWASGSRRAGRSSRRAGDAAGALTRGGSRQAR